MWLLRLLGVLSAITVAAGVVLYVCTGDRRYGQFAWLIFRYSLLIALLVFALLILERVAVIPV